VPYKAAGYAQGDASHECYQQIQRHELYGQLFKWYSGQWYQMVTSLSAANGPQKIATHPRYQCVNNSVWRNWLHRATAYTKDRFGTWWAASRDTQNQFQCG
jgi:hypothetical protein